MTRVPECHPAQRPTAQAPVARFKQLVDFPLRLVLVLVLGLGAVPGVLHAGKGSAPAVPWADVMRGRPVAPAGAVSFQCDVPSMPGIRRPLPRDLKTTDTAAQQDWPYSPWMVPVVSQRLRAIFVANDDGSRRTHITPSEVALWVAEANAIYQPSGIQIQFDPSPRAGDWQEFNSTLLNSMTGTDHPSWTQQRDLANQIAAQTPDRMTVFFRWGPDALPTGGGFSWTDYDFIVMPGFLDTWVCGAQNIGILAHEVGHYLGLPHTFPQVFSSMSAAEEYFNAGGRDPEVFNADGRDETNPDPFVGTAAIQCDATVTSITLDRVQFPLTRPNIMSYYFPGAGLVNSQSWTVRQGMLVRSNQGLSHIVSQAARSVEGESRVPTVTQGGWSHQVMTGFHGKWSGNQQLLWMDAGRDAALSTSFSVTTPGTYDVYGSFTAGPDFGIHTHYINGQPTVPVDLYSGIVLVTGPVYLGRFDLGTTNEWRVVATGSNPRAVPRHGYGLDYLLVATPGTVDVISPPVSADASRLMPGTPNPFMEGTSIRFRVAERGRVVLRIYDVAGRVVRTLADGEHDAGEHSVRWPGTDEDGNAVRSGVYLCRLTAGSRLHTTRLVRLR